ncbi:MAG: flagellar hook-basal body protein [Bordetella sp.]|nr:flagellar hook-basal body protein [Bordetella sp.]
MIDVLAVSLQGMQQDSARMERISANLANAMTPGYKREMASPLPQGAQFSGGTFAAAVEDVPVRSPLEAPARLLVKTDLKPGTLRATGRPMDVALTGRGYFEVATDDGVAYTRQGEFRVDARGRLVTAVGARPVMGVAGLVVLTQADPVIDEAGRIFERRADGSIDTAPVAQLKIVDVEDTAMHSRGGGLLAPEGGNPVELVASDVQLRQGFLENANVNSTHEMVQLIQTMRHFESMQKVATGYDEMLGMAVRKLGDLG